MADELVPHIVGMKHIGWWSEGNGFTPTSKDESDRARRFMYSRGDEPVYIQRIPKQGQDNPMTDKREGAAE